MKLLFYHDGALGDFILSLPVIQSLCFSHRAPKVHLIGRPPALSLIPLIPFIAHGTSSDNQFFYPLYSEKILLTPALKTFLAPFDKAFIFTRKINSLIFKNIHKCCAQTYLIHTIPEKDQKIHVTNYQMSQISRLINKGKAPCLETQKLIIPSHNDLTSAVNLISDLSKSKEKVIIIHPGSGGRKKCWPLPFYIELMKRIEKEFTPVFLILSGPAEENSYNHLKKHLTSDCGIKNIKLIQCQPLPVIAALLSLAALYIGNDSGVSHLASNLAPHVVVLFGPTDPVLWAPQGKNVTLIAADTSCAPCTENHYRLCDKQNCLNEISVDRVWDITISALSMR